MKYEVAGVGEVLIDFTPSGVNELGIALFGRNPGGGVANVLAALAKLGAKTAFIGKAGEDDFGRYLKQVLTDSGIDTKGMLLSEEYKTTLAFVQLNAQGDRSFTFYRKACADVMLKADELNRYVLENCNMLHFGSVSLTEEPSRSATLTAVEIAREKGAIISYDPNYRPLLWENTDTAVKEMRNAIKYAHIVKMSDNEVELMTGEKDYLSGARKLIDNGAVLVFVTAGKDGAYFCTKQHEGHIPTFAVEVVDTTGAGDTFMGAALYQLKDKTLDEIAAICKEELEELVRFANAAGSLTTTKRGAIPAMPGKADVLRLMGR